jgi:hypothetical protein
VDPLPNAETRDDLITNYNLFPCNYDEEGLSCKTYKDDKMEESIHANKSISLNLEGNVKGQNIFAGYMIKEENKKIFKREVDEDESDPWSLISPIGTLKRLLEFKKKSYRQKVY